MFNIKVWCILQLLDSPIDEIQRIAAGAMCQLAAEKEGIKLLELGGATALLMELLHSRNEGVASNAAAALFKIQEDKLRNYEQKLSAMLSRSPVIGHQNMECPDVSI